MGTDLLERSRLAQLEAPIEKLLEYKATERRLVGRLLAYWHLLCRGRTYPRLGDIDPDAISEDWRWSFILDTEEHRDFPNFRYLGSEVAKYSGVFLSGEDAFTTTLLDMATHKLERVFKEGCPLLMEDEVTRFDGRRLSFRAVLLPLSDDGETINFVLGAANGKLEGA